MTPVYLKVDQSQLDKSKWYNYAQRLQHYE